MNFLAHLFLSPANSEILSGNFIADAVKGKAYQNYSPGISKGILLHRAIDDFTDRHPVTEKSKKRLRPRYRKYAGVIIDVIYDHYLASSWDEFTDKPLEIFTAETYLHLEKNKKFFPEKSRHMLPYMVNHDWLGSYRRIKGISKALRGLSRRTTFESGMEHATHELQLYYQEFYEEFMLFFPELQKFSSSKLEQLNHQD